VLLALIRLRDPSFVCARPHSSTGRPSFVLHPPLFWLFWLCHLYNHN
jgi:hypothetical protein